MKRRRLFQKRIHVLHYTNPVIRLSFDDIQEEKNAKWLKEYLKYLIGVTELKINVIRQHSYSIKSFLRFLDEKKMVVWQVTRKEMDDYFKRMDEGDKEAATFNCRVVAIYHFFEFLHIRKCMLKVPFFVEYYLKEVLPTHNDRCVSASEMRVIHMHLKYFPKHLRLMYLHLWSLGLRISEVCTLKGNAYYESQNETWLRIYQIKVRGEKVVPIPKTLYGLMREYIKEKGIASDEFVFQNKKGGAFHTGTFYSQMIKELKRHKIGCDGQTFRTHDYRHNVATYLHTHGASLQAIRDYLGHESEDMTKQYIDYLPQIVFRKSEQYFKESGTSLAAELRREDFDEN